jgi:hypothetical protein
LFIAQKEDFIVDTVEKLTSKHGSISKAAVVVDQATSSGRDDVKVW